MSAALLALAVLLQASPDQDAACQALAPRLLGDMGLDQLVRAQFPNDPRAVEQVQASLARACASRTEAEVKCAVEAKPGQAGACEWVLTAVADTLKAYERSAQGAALPAAPPEGAGKEERCRAAFTSMAVALHLREQAAQDPRKGREFLGGTEPHFVQDCLLLPDREIACVFGKAQSELRACARAMQTLMTAGQRFVVSKDPRAVAHFSKETLQQEAKANLRGLASALLRRFEEQPAAVKKLTRLPALPAGDCCKQKEKKCPLDRAAFSRPGWKELGWVPANDLRYRYSLARTSPSVVVLRAEGDPACDGQAEVWELLVTFGDGGVSAGTPQLVKK